MAGDTPAAARKRPSLRSELMFNLGFLAAGALLLAVPTAVLAPMLSSTTDGVVLVVGLVAADVFIFILFGRYLISRHVTRPLDALVQATDAVARGRLDARAPEAATRELDELGASVNRMTARLLDAQSALVSAEKLASVGRLAAGIAHEIGNPLSAAVNYTEVLRRRGADAEVIKALGTELGRMDTIVRGLLDYARPRPVQREPLDMGDVARGALALLAAQGVLRRVSVDVTAIGPAPVMADRAALEQVCVNLLLNAVQAAGEGGRVSVGAGRAAMNGVVLPRASDGAGAAPPRRRSQEAPHFLGDAAHVIQLVIGDSGPGVAEEDRGRIFDPFVTTKAPGDGTGLGLAIVQRLVHDHDGRIDVRVAREGGAAFVVTLPERA